MQRKEVQKICYLTKYKEIDWSYANEKKIPNLPNDKDSGGRFKEEIICSKITYKGKYVGAVLKENGVKIKDNYILCIDIDCKNDRGNTKEEQEELFNKVKDILNVNRRYPHYEQTQNGGYHLWFYINKEDFEKINGKKAIRIESTKDDSEKNKAKKEIEFFSRSKFIVLYKEIDFYDLDLITYESIDMLSQLQEQKIEQFDTEEEIEEDAISGQNKLTVLRKSEKNIPEITSFVNGEWVGYDFVKNEIMRFYIILNQEEEFIKVIKEKHPNYYNVWKSYPENYLKFTNNNRLPSKNSEHLKWLKELRYFKKKTQTKEDKVKLADLSIFTENTISMNSEVAFYWNGKCFEVLEPTAIKNKLFEHYEGKGVYSNEELLQETYMRTYRIALSRAKEYNLIKDDTFMEKVSITFSNGTLYIKNNVLEFKENEFLPQNRCFTHFTVPYEKNEQIADAAQVDDSIVSEWLNKRFETQHERSFFLMCVSDLLVTQNNSEILPFFYGDAGRGKTIFLEAMQNILRRDTVSSLSVNDFNSRFSKVALLKSCINMSSEISRRSVNSDIFKRIISREIIEMEYKGVQNLMGRPLAKHIAVANDIPEIDLDSGVERRFCIIKIKSEKLREEMSKNEYKYSFFNDYKILIGYIIRGIQMLQTIKFDLASFYEQNISKEHKEEFLQRNDTIRYFVNEVYEIKEEHEGYTTTEILEHFNIFRTKTEGTGIHAVKLVTMGKRIGELKITKKRAVRTNGIPTYKNTGIKLKQKWQTIIERKYNEDMGEEF